MIKPSRLRVIAIGKVRKQWIKDGLNLYFKRLPGLTVTELRDSGIQKESQAIHQSISPNELPITLSEEGELVKSSSLAQRLKTFGSQRLVFIIGGANGLSPETKKIAFWNLSLSPLTLPHELARLLLIEQLYRASTILQGSPYHRD